MLIKCLDNDKYLFYCPGCNCYHWFTVPKWTWNGNFEKPTVSPSIITSPHDPRIKCHLQIICGELKYFTDSRHYLSGISISMVDLEEMEEKLK